MPGLATRSELQSTQLHSIPSPSQSPSALSSTHLPSLKDVTSPTPSLRRHSKSTSPYQQRGFSSGPFANYQQTSPAPPPPASIPRLSSTPSGYDSQRTSTSEQPQSERERSLSVSPKTRLPSHPPGSTPQQHGSPYATKRKMDERENSIEQPRRFEQHDVKPQVNGEYRAPRPNTSSPQEPARKRVRYTQIPIWAQSVRNNPNFSGASNRAASKVNGKQPIPQLQSQMTSSPLVKSETNGHQQMAGAVNRAGPSPDVAVDDASVLLGPWEKSIIGTKPYDSVAKTVADWLYGLVVNRQDFGELSTRGVEIEIEAKLGQLVDTDTSVRYQLPISNEVILREMKRIRFESSMTEV